MSDCYSPNIILLPCKEIEYRCRAIASAYIFTRYMKSNLFINWHPHELCSVNIQNILQNNFQSIDINSLDPKTYVHDTDVHPNILIKQTLNKNDSHVKYIIIHTGDDFKHPNMSCIEFIQKKHSFYLNDLKWNSSIYNSVNSFISINSLHSDRNHILGVSYTKDDDISLYELSKIVLSTINRYYSIYEIYPTILFYSREKPSNNAFRTIMNHLTKNKSNHELNIISYSNEHLQTTKDTITNNSIKVFEDIINMLLLSKTNYLIGSFQCCLSDQSSYFNFTPKQYTIQTTHKLVNNIDTNFDTTFVFSKPYLNVDIKKLIIFSP